MIWPSVNYIYQGYCIVHIITVDKDDEQGRRIVTAEKLMGKVIEELRYVVREHPRLRV